MTKSNLLQSQIASVDWYRDRLSGNWMAMGLIDSVFIRIKQRADTKHYISALSSVMTSILPGGYKFINSAETKVLSSNNL